MGDLTSYASLTISSRTVFGNKKIVMGYVAVGDGSNDWPSGGLSLTPANMGLGGVDLVLFEPKSLCYYYDYSNEKIDGYVAASGTGADTPHVQADAATFTEENVHFIAIGYRG